MSVMKQHKMAMELQALSEAGREELIKKVAEMQKKHAAAVMTLSTPAERAAYIRGIPEEVRVLVLLLSMGMFRDSIE